MNDSLRTHLREYAQAVFECQDCTQELCDIHQIERDFLDAKLKEARENAPNHN